MSIPQFRWLGWSIGVVTGLLVSIALELLLGHGGGGIGVALSVVGGGIVVHLRQRATPLCRINGPRLRPLQVSAFGLMGLGVHWYQLHGDGAVARLSALWPVFSATWLPLALVIAGVGWLAFLSISSDCRDEQLLAVIGDRDHEQ